LDGIDSDFILHSLFVLEIDPDALIALATERRFRIGSPGILFRGWTLAEEGV
jgi:hypothetical protein